MTKLHCPNNLYKNIITNPKIILLFPYKNTDCNIQKHILKLKFINN